MSWFYSWGRGHSRTEEFTVPGTRIIDIETAKANHLAPHAYIKHIFNHITAADTLEKLEALLPWNVGLG